MSELTVGSLSGLAANSYVVDVAAGSTFDLANAKAESLPTSAIGTGGILQVVQGTKTDTFSTSLVSGATATITGFSASITPRSTSSKILVLVSMTTSNQSNGIGYLLERNSTGIGLGDAAGSRTRLTFGGTSNDGSMSPQSSVGMILDSPSSTSTLTYSITAQNVSNTTSLYYFNRSEGDTDAAWTGRYSSTITLLEVAG